MPLVKHWQKYWHYTSTTDTISRTSDKHAHTMSQQRKIVETIGINAESRESHDVPRLHRQQAHRSRWRLSPAVFHVVSQCGRSGWVLVLILQFYCGAIEHRGRYTAYMASHIWSAPPVSKSAVACYYHNYNSEINNNGIVTTVSLLTLEVYKAQ